MKLRSKVGMARGPVLYRQKQSSRVLRPNWNFKRSPKVVRKERALTLNAPWDSTAMGWKIYELLLLLLLLLLS